MNVLDLFSGIGGFSYGLEKAGMQTIAFCEIEPYCRAVIAKHWPGIPIFEDITKLEVMVDAASEGKRRILADICEKNGRPRRPLLQFSDSTSESIDLICGGFPCQDISVAGKGAGITGSRSGLWSEFARLIGEIRPRYVIVENVAALLSRGLKVVLQDLAEIGYDAEWHIISAADVGAPHLRKRVWIVAYPTESGSGGESRDALHKGRLTGESGRAGISEATRWEDGAAICNTQSASEDAAYTNQPRPQGWLGKILSERAGEWLVGEGGSYEMGNTAYGELPSRWNSLQSESETTRNGETIRIGCTSRSGAGYGSQWSTEPNVGRVAHGVPNRVHRLKGLGNAIVPVIAEIIGKAIIEEEIRYATNKL